MVLDRLQRQLDGAAAVVGPGANLRYLTGFTGERDRALALLLTEEDCIAVTAAGYETQVRQEMGLTSVSTVPTNDPVSIGERIADLLHQRDSHTVFVDEELPMGIGRSIAGDLQWELVDGRDIFDPLRRVKTAAERAALRRSAAVADEVRAATIEIGADVVGLTEAALARRIHAMLVERGGAGPAFPIVVASGPHGAAPLSHRHGNRLIRSGEPVVLDFGTIVDGYASDQTSTVVFDGTPPSEFPAAFAAVEAALDAGVGAVRPGRDAAELDEIVRNELDERGFRDAFTTGTGHGIGLRAHEPPTIGPDADDVLEPGMAITIEPGIYLPERFGVRLETVVIVTDKGGESINDVHREWRLAD